MGLLILTLVAFFLLALFGIGLWIGLGKFVRDNRTKLGVGKGIILLHFALCAIIILVLSFIIARLNVCHGFLCGLDALFIFMIAANVVFIAWPVIVLVYYRKMKADFKKD
jgi:hypothetical protein